MRIEGGTSFPITQNTQHNSVENFPKKNNKEQQILEVFFNENELIKGIESANEKIEVYNNRLEFSIHEKTKDIMIKIIDTQTNEVIREIPSKKIVDMIANMLEQAGLLVDERA